MNRPIDEQSHSNKKVWVWGLGVLLVSNAWCLFLGLTIDAVTVATTLKKSLGPFTLRIVDERETFSILSSIGRLWEEGSLVLAVVIFLFSVIFPILKWTTNVALWVGGLAQVPQGKETSVRIARLLHVFGRWSMLDVFVVGILCVWGKLGEVTRFIVEPGLYWFFAAVILSLANALLTEKGLEKTSGKNSICNRKLT